MVFMFPQPFFRLSFRYLRRSHNTTSTFIFREEHIVMATVWWSLPNESIARVSEQIVICVTDRRDASRTLRIVDCEVRPHGWQDDLTEGLPSGGLHCISAIARR
jgi:hypothetical protein